MYFLKELYDNFKNKNRLVSIKMCCFILFINKIKPPMLIKLGFDSINREAILKLLHHFKLSELIDSIELLSVFNEEYGKLSIDDIINYHLMNDTYLDAIEYCDYFSNNRLIKWITENYKQSANTLSLNYRFTTFSSDFNVYHDDIISIVMMNCIIENKQKQINYTHDVLKKDIDKNFDTIVGMLPSKMTNIIHAKCCKKIKDLKIRGTKSEPLYLQYIMKSLNNNGNCIIVVPDHLLFNDSKQHVETRKYLIDNFNLKQIVQLSCEFFYKKNQKYSLLYFTKSGTTKTIEYSKLNSECIIDKLGTLNYNDIINNNNILFINYYTNKTHLINNVSSTNNIKLIELYNITNTTNLNNIIRISKTYKNDNSIVQYDPINHLYENDAYYLVPKNNIINEYYNLYILNILKPLMNKLLKNNSNQYDINEIGNLCILIVDEIMQKKIIDYYMFRNLLINTNNEHVNNFINLQNNFMTISIKLHSEGTCDLENICNIYSHNNIVNKNSKYIGIVKNSSAVGNIFISNENFNSNSYYLSIKDEKTNEYDLMYIYTWLKYNNAILFDIANNNTQKILNKANISNFIVTKLNYKIQTNIIHNYNQYDEMINKLHDTNKLLYNCNNGLNI